jgi:Phage portal protein, SPP1 Gp6-like
VTDANADDLAGVWRDLLLAKLDARRPDTITRMAYYAGDHRLPTAPEKARDAYRRFLLMARTNWCRLVVDAVAERLRVVGFRFGEGLEGDDSAWQVWQANAMDADHEMAQNDALVCGHSFVMVWPDDDSPVGVRISIEHPLQTTVAYDPGDRRQRIAALKTWLDPLAQRRYAWLCTAFTAYLWSRPAAETERTAVAAGAAAGWEIEEGFPTDNPLGEVPVVELRPWPRTLGPGWSEIDGGVIDIQDRINVTILNRMMASEYAAFRQKWATGLVLATKRDPVTGDEILDPAGNPIAVEPFNSAVDRLWVAEDSNVKFGEFSESDLAGYIRAVEADVQHLAAITHTPPHYLLGSIVNASGDALKAAEAGLVAKVRFRASHLGEAWEEVMRLAFHALGDERAVDFQAETVWADFETRSESEHVDALVKLATIGVPEPVLWARAGASPQEVRTWSALRAQATLLGLVPVPAAAPVAPAPSAPVAG